MSASAERDGRSTTERWWLRPRVVLPVMAAAVALVALVTPRPHVDMDDRLTTYSAGPMGARGTYDMLAGLGWRVSRRTTRLDTALDTGAVYAILAPQVPLDSAECLALLRMVQAGGRVLLVSTDSEFTAPFRMYATYARARAVPIDSTSAAGDSVGIVHRHGHPEPSDDFPFGEIGTIPRFVVSPTPPVTDTLAFFLWASPDRDDSATAAPLVLGRRVGRGRAVLVGAPLLLWNRTVREGHTAVAVQRALEWLAPPNRVVVFDEYHQTYHKPAGPDVFGAIGRALTETAVGRAGVQGIAAALILLLAIGVRPISPRPTTVLQRRSLLEHVDALGRAYQQIRAGQFGISQLLRGLRRRHPMGGAATRRTAVTDAEYLTMIQERYGTAQRDITAITRALDTPVGDDTFAEAGQAVGRIEHSIHRQ